MGGFKISFSIDNAKRKLEYLEASIGAGTAVTMAMTLALSALNTITPTAANALIGIGFAAVAVKGFIGSQKTPQADDERTASLTQPLLPQAADLSMVATQRDFSVPTGMALAAVTALAGGLSNFAHEAGLGDPSETGAYYDLFLGLTTVGFSFGFINQFDLQSALAAGGCAIAAAVATTSGFELAGYPDLSLPKGLILPIAFECIATANLIQSWNEYRGKKAPLLDLLFAIGAVTSLATGITEADTNQPQTKTIESLAGATICFALHKAIPFFNAHSTPQYDYVTPKEDQSLT